MHNLTENDEVCKELPIAEFVKYTNKMFKNYANSESSQQFDSGNINELAIKSLINICHHNKDSFEDENSELKELLENIASLYSRFENLAKQYSLRLVTILTRQWNQDQLERHLAQVISIISEFISACSSSIEMRLIQFNLDKIASFKEQMKRLANDEKCKDLINNIASFLDSN